MVYTGRTAQKADSAQCVSHQPGVSCSQGQPLSPTLLLPTPQPSSSSCLEAQAMSVSQLVSVGGFSLDIVSQELGKA